MKFYYNNKLLRTSKNHNYTHAIIDISKDDACKGCRTSADACRSEINSEISRYNQSIENYKKAIKCLESGSKGYSCKDGRRSIFIKFDNNSSVEEYERWIKSAESSIEYVKNNYKVVEVEAREK